MSIRCFEQSNSVEISNNQYIFNNIFETSYNLYETSNNAYYTINNIPRNHPLGFFINQHQQSSDISYSYNSSSNIIIYVSKGNDLSFNNGDYFRFYDESYNLINIDHSNPITGLTDNSDNFYFMRGASYQFIANFDFSSVYPFEISSNALRDNLTNTDQSFVFIIPIDADNSTNKITYYDSSNINNISGDLKILVDDSNNSYFYNSIRLDVSGHFDNAFSIKSYNGDISNINLFYYSDTCAYIINSITEQQSELQSISSECLTQISRCDFSSIMQNYIFNCDTHNSDINTNVSIQNLKYGLYDGSFIIFNIRSDYPITLDNEEISNNIYINSNYYYTRKYDKNSGLIQSLSSNTNYTNYDYYYGAIQIVINNNNTFTQNQDISFLILDLSSNNVIEISNTLFYTTFCQTTNAKDNFLEFSNNDINFSLYNQNNILFNNINNNSNENKYKLNIYEPYRQIRNQNIIQEFSASDKYNHDLTNLIDISLIVSTVPHGNDASNIEIIENLTNNYENQEFIITYNLKYFDLSDITLERIVEINYGVVIEISNNEEIFINNNSLTKNIDISTNIILDNSYNFYKYIDVYIRDISRNKIFLPFNVTLNGRYYNNINSRSTRELDKIIKNYRDSYNPNTRNTNRNGTVINDLTHYISKNLTLTLDPNPVSNTNSILLSNNPSTPNSIILNNIDTSNIYTNNETFKNLIMDISNIVNVNFNNNNIGFSNQSIFGDEKSIIITNITKNSNNYELNIDISSNYDNVTSINATIIFIKETQNSREQYDITLRELSNNIATGSFVNISGEFKDIDFFENLNTNNNNSNNTELIDISYIGNYNLTIDTKGLETYDYIFNTISNIIFIPSSSSNNQVLNDISTSYNIVISDREKPVLSFLNNTVQTSSTISSNNSLQYNYPRNERFYITNNNTNSSSNIDFSNNSSIGNRNIPYINYSENSIYIPTISYNIIEGFTNISFGNTSDNIAFIDVSNSGENANCSIEYRAIDLCFNVSDPIRLDISFLNIPMIELSGNSNIKHEIYNVYEDDGLIIRINDSNNIIVTNNKDHSRTEYDNNTQTNYNDTFTSDPSYVIDVSINLNLESFGSYTLTYNVGFSGETNFNFITRNIEIVKENEPFIRLVEISNNNNTFDFSNTIINNSNYVLNHSEYRDFSSGSNNFNVDFSLTYNSNFSDLSTILNAYDLCDNYFADTSLNLQIIINLSNQEILYKEISNNNVNYFINNNNDLSFNNTHYLTNDLSFDIVTRSIVNAQPRLDISYIITDPCNNSFSFNRIINIVDITPPTITFSDLTNIINIDNSNIIYFEEYNFKDFSYQAYNYDNNNSGFLNEISNILLGFELNDNYVDDPISNNFHITISGATFTKNEIQNIINNSENTNSQLNILKNKFKDIDTSFQIIYDFSDNQYNTNTSTRNIHVINTIEPSLNIFTNIFGNTDTFINISFNNINYNFLNDICLNHIRLNSTDISFDLSYILPSHITSISGLNNNNYDPSALINQYMFGNVTKTINDISFFNIATNPNSQTISSEILTPNINIIIDPPSFNLTNYDTISHEAGTYLSDASLINGISVTSTFDIFYFNNNVTTISYSETNFDVSFYVPFNTPFDQNNPIIIGNTNNINITIIYTATDQNDISSTVTRELIIQDTQGPLFQYINGNDVSSNVTNQFTQFSNYNNEFNNNLIIRDIGSDLSSLIIEINKISTTQQNIDSSNLTITIDLSGYNKSYVFNIPTFDFINLNDYTYYYTINYTAYDIHDNSRAITRRININQGDNIILNPQLIFIQENSNNIYSLNENFSITNDISLIYNNTTKTITYEATSIEIFNQYIDFSLNPILIINNSNIAISNIINPINNIIPNLVGNYRIFFQAFNLTGSNFIAQSDSINFNVIDTTPPQLELSNNTIYLPLLSQEKYITLLTNTNFFNAYYKNNIEFLIIDNKVIFSIQGVTISDITSPNIVITSLSNETLINNNNFNLSVSYEISGSIVDNSYILTNSGNYEQIYRVTDNYNNSSDISRNIIIQEFPPFLQFNYLNNIKTIDDLNNIFPREYHNIYLQYELIETISFDYYYNNNITITLPNINDINVINVNEQNVYNLDYKIHNTLNDLSSIHTHSVEIVELIQISNIININNIIYNNENNIKYGIYGTTSFTILIGDNSNNAIRLQKLSENTSILNNQNNSIDDNSYNLIVFYSDLSFINENDNERYFYGSVDVSINGNFNRASIYLNNSNNLIQDFIIYNINFERTSLNNIVNTSTIRENDFELKVQEDTTSNFKCFGLRRRINNTDNFENKPNLYLSFGTYYFYQGDYSNFHNPIKFSYLPDGHHFNYNSLSGEVTSNLSLMSLNNIQDLSFNNRNDPNYIYSNYNYTKNVLVNGFPGFKDRFNNSSEQDESRNIPYTRITIDATTPSPLYYYSNNYSNMGGKIEIKNNITLVKQNNSLNTILNGNILTIDNSSIDYTNTTYTDDFTNKNRILLSQHFDLSYNFNNETRIIHKDFIGLTQENINHNMIFNNNKIIFKKYENMETNNSDVSAIYPDITNYNINYDNSNNYLYDSSVNNIRTQLLFFEFIIDSSINLIRNNNDYELNISDLFYTNNVINNYYHFFKKNNIDDLTLTNNNFIYKINEINYINKINILDGGNNYQFFTDDYLQSNFIYFQPFFDNKIIMNLQIYMDPQNMDYDNNRINYLINNIFNLNNRNIQSNYDIDLSNLFFEEFIFTLYSDICGILTQDTPPGEKSLIFSNDTLEFNDFLLDSSYSNNIIGDLMQNVDSSNEIIKDRIFLTLKDNSGNLMSRFNGITQQNIYHNMIIDDNKFIFHKYDITSVNSFVTNKNSSLSENINSLINNNRYLIELSNNDPFNCFVNNTNVYDNTNSIGKNNYLTIAQPNILLSDPTASLDPASQINLKTRISYNIINELEISNNYLTTAFFDIRPMPLNDISYELFPYSYDLSFQTFHSHSYIINLENHIDRNFYNTNTFANIIPHNIINYTKLYYVIKDISYDSLHDFSIYDLGNNQNIIYNKEKINILIDLQSLIFIVNFKLDFFGEAIIYSFGTIQNIIRNIIETQNNLYIYSNNYANLVELYSDTNFINSNYNLNISTQSLNDLFGFVYYNSNIIIQKYNNFTNINNIFYNNFIQITNIYNNIRNFDSINQILTDINFINSSIDREFLNYFNLYDTNFTVNNFPLVLSDSTPYSIIQNTFLQIKNLIDDFQVLRNKYEKVKFELNLRSDTGFIDINIINNINNNYNNIFNSSDFSSCYSNLIDNYITLYNSIESDICNTTLNYIYFRGNQWNYVNIRDLTLTGLTFNLIDISYTYNINNLNITPLYDLLNLQVNQSLASNPSPITISDTSMSIHDYSFNIAINYILNNDISINDSIRDNNYIIYLESNNSDFRFELKKNVSAFDNIDFRNNEINKFLEKFNSDRSNYYDSNNNINIDNFLINKVALETIINFYVDNSNFFYDYLRKLVETQNINYILNGNSILVNSFKSNNIVIKYDVYYNSFLYNNIYLDTKVLDMAIPDYTPPTLTFREPQITIQNTLMNSNTINTIIEQLLDISYVDINQENNENLSTDLSINNINYSYYDNNISDFSNINTDYDGVIITIDISNTNNTINNITNIIYTIKDYANNENVIIRPVLVDFNFDPPELYIISNLERIRIINNYFDTIYNLNILDSDTNEIIIRKAKNNIAIRDPENDITQYYTLTIIPEFDNLLNIRINYNTENLPFEIIYTLTSAININNSIVIRRNINIITSDDTIITPSHCCYPAVYYKPIQHNYKLGSLGSSKMRLAKFIINS